LIVEEIKFQNIFWKTKAKTFLADVLARKVESSGKKEITFYVQQFVLITGKINYLFSVLKTSKIKNPGTRKI
jgi:hypothetical protein